MEEWLREFVRERAGHRCEYCRLHQEALPWARFHVEHIRAIQHRGGDEPENLALACHRCNLFKGPNLTSYDPQTDGLVRLFNPRIDDWDEHFRVVEFQIVGLTPIGRTTVTLLHMNEPDRIQLRRELEGTGLEE